MGVKTNYYWDEETGVMLCEVEYRGKIYKGMAVCHEDDADFKSELVGGELALLRAHIKLFKGMKQEEKLKLATLNSLYMSMKSSWRFNPDSFEAQMLKKNIYKVQTDIETINDIIEETRQTIKKRIETNEDFFNKVRLRRQKATIPN